MSIALIANGHITDYSQTLERLRSFRTIIAVDGGLNHCHRMGVLPGLIVGDFDSIEPDLLKNYSDVPKHTFSRDKDQTDLELALQEVVGLDSEGIVVFGALGLRTDHTVANLHLLRRYPGKVVFEGQDERIFAIAGEVDVACYPGQVMSLIPLDGPVEGVTTKGFRWELVNATLNKDFLSISNECLGSSVHISIGKGDLLVFQIYHHHIPLVPAPERRGTGS